MLRLHTVWCHVGQQLSEASLATVLNHCLPSWGNGSCLRLATEIGNVVQTAVVPTFNQYLGEARHREKSPRMPTCRADLRYSRNWCHFPCCNRPDQLF